MKRILIVEDDALLNKTLAYNLTSDGWEVTPALNAKTAASLLSKTEYDLVLLDINLPDGNGYDLCKLIKPEHPDTVVIFLTANDQEADQLRGYEVGAVDYITKPFSIEALQRKIRAMFAMLEHHRPAKDLYDDGRLFLLTLLFAKRLSWFTGELCRMLDNMIRGSEEPERAGDRDTIFARINHRLSQLYRILQENRRKVDQERQELQTLVSDISHQVKTPVANLKMVTDTLLAKPVTEQERRDFLQGIRSQTDKLEFLFQSLVKTSRLETGAITLEKRDGPLIDTLAQAMSGIVYGAEQKRIAVSVECPEDLRVSHDGKWTAEALFNLLDNAVKYTPAGGRISVSVEEWEMYVKLDVADTGRGVPESRQAAIFRRFYREEEVHDQPGVGIGLYLAREIISRQGGYIKVTSEPGRGSAFSVFLPRR